MLRYLTHSGELCPGVCWPNPCVSVDDDPVAALQVVRLQLSKVRGVARVWLPANTADLINNHFRSLNIPQNKNTSEIFLS